MALGTDPLLVPTAPLGLFRQVSGSDYARRVVCTVAGAALAHPDFPFNLPECFTPVGT